MLGDVDVQYLRRAIALARSARQHGNHPFGALLLGADQQVLAEAENTVVTARDCTGHAELNLMRAASQRYGREVLVRSTLYTSTEPCAMCAGAIHWGGVGRVVFGLSEPRLHSLIGANPANGMMRLPCREVFARCDRRIVVVGPELEDEAVEVHVGFWGATV